MKFYWIMPASLKLYYQYGVEFYKEKRGKGYLQTAWIPLGRTLLGGRCWFVQYTHALWLRLKFGIKIKRKKEIIRQLPRLFGGQCKIFFWEGSSLQCQLFAIAGG